METQQSKVESLIAPLKKITPLSKYLAMILFIAMPFIGGWIGYTYTPEKVVEVETPPSIVGIQTESALPSITDMQKMFLEGKPESYEIEPLYTTKEGDVQYFKLLKGTSACCGIYKYLSNTNSFHQTGLGIDTVVGEKESPTGRYVVKVSWEKALDIYDLETQSIENDVMISEGETLIAETCRYAGYSYDLQWLDEDTLQYGVYKSLEVEEGCPEMELIEHRKLQMK
jgi:hypothetical protein